MNSGGSTHLINYSLCAQASGGSLVTLDVGTISATTAPSDAWGIFNADGLMSNAPAGALTVGFCVANPSGVAFSVMSETGYFMLVPAGS
jgi:hypothetical protein